MLFEGLLCHRKVSFNCDISKLFLVKAPSVSFFKVFFYRVVPCKVLRCYLIIVVLSSRGPTQSRGPSRRSWSGNAVAGSDRFQFRSEGIGAEGESPRRWWRTSIGVVIGAGRQCEEKREMLLVLLRIDYGQSRLYTNMQANRKLRSAVEGVCQEKVTGGIASRRRRNLWYRRRDDSIAFLSRLPIFIRHFEIAIFSSESLIGNRRSYTFIFTEIKISGSEFFAIFF